jgi:hypothetical protein
MPLLGLQREDLTAAGFSGDQAEILVSILEVVGQTRRTFDYATSFPALDPNCVATFARSFEHQDWIDGESVVQAEQTTGEEGFNLRFHRIEQDLDRLGGDVAKAFLCMAAMRTSLRYLLDEIRAEINRLNNDVYECCQGQPVDRIPPVIGAVQATAVTGTGATITWSTNEPADSQVEYGPTMAYGSSTPLDAALATAHSVTLPGLTPKTLYHYRVKSKDAADNSAVSGDFTFTTPDTIPPVITGVQASAITRTGATITWTTDEPADSQVGYGTSTSYSSSAPPAPAPALVTNHSVQLSGLTPGTTYHYVVRSKDAAGNPAVSGDSTLVTAPPDTNPPVITDVHVDAGRGRATIDWTTNEPADAAVEFRSSEPPSGPFTVRPSPDPGLVTRHTVILRGLIADTHYSYQIRSRDAEGNLATHDGGFFHPGLIP